MQPLILDEKGELVAGHAIYLAHKQLGSCELPTVSLLGLTSTDKRRRRIALNKLGDLSRFSVDFSRGAALGDGVHVDIPLARPVAQLCAGPDEGGRVSRLCELETALVQVVGDQARPA